MDRIKLFKYLSIYLSVLIFSHISILAQTREYQILKDVYSVYNWSKKPYRIRYCAVGLCTDFVGKDEILVNRFALIFLYYGPQGIFEKKIKAKVDSKFMNKLIEDNKGNCSKSVNLSRCTLINLGEKGEIQVISVRHDEGYECHTEYSLIDLLDKNNPPKIKPKNKCWKQ